MSALHDLLTPLPHSDMAVTQSDAYRDLRAEVAKLDSPSVRVNWPTVTAMSRRVLQQYGKDALAIVYAAHAHHVQNGAPGLPEACDFVTCAFDLFWETMSPPLARLKARAGALEWFVQRTDIAWESREPTPAALAAATHAAVRALQTMSLARLAAASPAFGPLMMRLDREEKSRPAPAPMSAASAPSAAPPVAAPQAAATPAPILQPTPAVTPVAPSGDLHGLGRSICTHAVALRRQDVTDAAAYRLLRQGLWLHLDSTPPIFDGRTRIQPLPAAQRADLEALAQAARWADASEACETAIAQFRLHLDLQRLSIQALRQLGGAFEAASLAAAHEVHGLIARLPDLPMLLAADGTPLADSDTQAWLKTLGAPARGVPVAAVAAPEAAANSYQQSFTDRLQQAEASMAAGHTRVAVALFQTLAHDVRRHRLELWEPALALRCFWGYLQALRALDTAPTALMDRIFLRVVQLSPQTAMRLKS